MKESSYLEELCKQEFSGALANRMYEALSHLVPANIPHSKKNIDEIANYDEILEAYPNQPGAYQLAGMIALLKGEYELASAHLETAAKMSPNMKPYYELVLQNTERVSRIMKQYYEGRASYERTYAKIDEPSEEILKEKDNETNKSGISKRIKGVIGVLTALAILGGGATLYYSGEASIAKRQAASLQEQVSSYQVEIDNYKQTISELESRLSELQQEERVNEIILYVQAELERGETITHEVAAYLRNLLGNEYLSLSSPARISLIADYCKLVYQANGIPLQKAPQIARNLQIGYTFYIPSAQLEKSNGGWVLKGKFFDASGKLVPFEINGMKYILDP
ncbi:MAG: hypothetical protein QW471_04725 [Candidatus Woesearchaeota archaeon]